MKKNFIILALILITLGVFYMNMTPEERVAVISTKHGDMVVEFYPDVAPMHVESFIALAEEEYFNGTTFHRVIPGFVIQGGDPNSKLDNRACLLYTSPSPRDLSTSRMPSSA